MKLSEAIVENVRETTSAYWVLMKITVPISLLVTVLSRTGAVAAIAPVFDPVMRLVGLPPELGLAWLTGMIVGLWGAIPLVFALVPVSSLSVADLTVFSALLLFSHGLPIEQKIIQKAGPGIIVTTLLRLGVGLLYALVLHHICNATGWLSAPVDPTWIPISTTPLWSDLLWDMAQTMIWIYVILLALSLGLEALRAVGLLELMMKVISPFLRLAGIKGDAVYLTAIGLFLGISYGAGLLIREARSGKIPPRQVFLSCVFMGFAHSLIEDTLIVMALGADIIGVLVGRIIVTFLVTAAIAYALRVTSDTTFFSVAFNIRRPAKYPQSAALR